jgi:hypothetical protein
MHETELDDRVGRNHDDGSWVRRCGDDRRLAVPPSWIHVWRGARRRPSSRPRRPALCRETSDVDEVRREARQHGAASPQQRDRLPRWDVSSPTRAPRRRRRLCEGKTAFVIHRRQRVVAGHLCRWADEVGGEHRGLLGAGEGERFASAPGQGVLAGLQHATGSGRTHPYRARDRVRGFSDPWYVGRGVPVQPEGIRPARGGRRPRRHPADWPHRACPAGERRALRSCAG